MNDDGEPEEEYTDAARTIDEARAVLDRVLMLSQADALERLEALERIAGIGPGSKKPPPCKTRQVAQ